MKRKWVIVGKKNSGKTTVADFIEGKKDKKSSSLDLYYRENTIEVPSEYLEVNYLNNIIIMISQNHAIGTLFILSAEDDVVYPPNFGKSFTRPTATIITKIDLVNKDKLEKIYKKALEIGANNIFLISNKTRKGLVELNNFIKDVSLSEVHY
ncbi:EutP/PduV family microcompartment system protein [Peptoniphilus sp. MSJ-1]|uniref:EutP/PduV family microcompartment system protein n=1 Tax=Peptoniphilus ovalis TaxID=2841503 RepID=A0ABS6FF66_9FIRM|nr:EutP/PduV family microcompartment system protein [Peptoniphilus ovalis]MBU5668828.1 EutP/PduV family microcompartment system protein [Peptoniphilus ovalis]